MKRNISGFPAGINQLWSNVSYSIEEVVNLIKNDENLKKLTKELRDLPDKQSQNEFKVKRLMYATWGGLFKKREDNSLIKASGYICIDIDNIEDVVTAKQKLIKECPYLISAFVSPTGKGLKLIFYCNPNHSFKINYKYIAAYLSYEFKIDSSKIDNACSHISRACFLCHDAEIYLNPLITEDNGERLVPILEDKYFAEKFEEETSETVSEINLFEQTEFKFYHSKFNFEKRNEISNFRLLSKLAIRDVGELKVGNRHNWFLCLATLCCKFGMEKEIALKYCKIYFEKHPAIVDTKNLFNEKVDLLKPFDDVYKNLESQFGTWEKNDTDWESPTIPLSVYDKLPDFIKRLTNLFDVQREKDIFFLGFLTLLSTCFPKVKGVYDSKNYQMNFFLFVIAPPGSGKGVLSWVRKSGEGIHEYFINKYKKELSEYNKLDAEAKKNEAPPVMQKLFLPADNTSAKMFKSIEANGSFGIIMDTEADTLTKAQNSEHGKYSDILRKGFQHEHLEYERKTNNEYIIINRPALSLLISGTPRQVNRLVNDLENGLVSRLLFYSYTSEAKWKNVFEEKENYDCIFKSVSVELEKLVEPYLQKFLANPKMQIDFKFSKIQKQKFNEWGDEKTKTLDHIYGDDIRASINRMGLIFFRLAMILTVMRKLDSFTNSSQELENTLICSDDDFSLTQSIIEVLTYHTTLVFEQLKSKGKVKNFRKLKESFLNKLPDNFNREKAMEIAALMQIKQKTAENYLTTAIQEGFILKPKHNFYQKQ